MRCKKKEKVRRIVNNTERKQNKSDQLDHINKNINHKILRTYINTTCNLQLERTRSPIGGFFVLP